MQPLTAQATAPPRLSLQSITSKTNGLPNRYGLHAVEGWGKTSLSAHFPAPVFIQTRGETGLETLIDAGRLPETPHFPEIVQWPDMRQAIRLLTNEKHSYRTLVVDTLNGAEKLCFEDTRRKHYENNVEKFMAYGKGPLTAAEEWRAFLQELDELRQQRKMIIMLLVHTKVAKFKNPEGSDFDRYQPELENAIWSLTHKWLDVVMFGNFYQDTATDKNDKRQKGVGGDTRMLYCTRTAAWDAKNRIGLPSQIQIGDSAHIAYQQLVEAIKAGRGTDGRGTVNAAGGTDTATQSTSQGGN